MSVRILLGIRTAYQPRYCEIRQHSQCFGALGFNEPLPTKDAHSWESYLSSHGSLWVIYQRASTAHDRQNMLSSLHKSKHVSIVDASFLSFTVWRRQNNSIVKRSIDVCLFIQEHEDHFEMTHWEAWSGSTIRLLLNCVWRIQVINRWDTTCRPTPIWFLLFQCSRGATQLYSS